MSTYNDSKGPRYTAEEVTRAMDGRWAEFYRLYTDLKPVGGQLCGRCPLHLGQGPNFKVNPQLGYWYCHSLCSRGGDVYEFIEAQHGVTFPEAVVSLARWVGLPLSEPMTLDSFKASRCPRQALLDPVSLVPYAGTKTSWFMPTPPGVRPADAVACHAALLADAEMVDWLRDHRGLTVETLERFGVGLTRNTGSDRARNMPWPRVTFPVHDRAGRLTNIRKHLFAFRGDIDRAKMGKTLPWAAGLPADLFPLSVLWGERAAEPRAEEPAPGAPGLPQAQPSEPTPPQAASPPAAGRAGGKAGVGFSGFSEGSRGEDASVQASVQASVVKTISPSDDLPAALPAAGGEAACGGPGSEGCACGGVGSEGCACGGPGSERGSGPVLRTGHILLVEGEADALLANQLGVPALTGTLGAGGWRPQNTQDLAGLARVTILYDADEAGRKGAKARVQDLAGTVPDIRLASLPPGLGKDLTEWVVEGGGTADGLRQIIDAAERTHPGAGTHPAASSGPPETGRRRGSEKAGDQASSPLRFGEGGEARAGRGLFPLPGGEGGEAQGAKGSLGRGSSKPLHERTIDLADVPAPPAELPYLWGPYLNEGASHWLTGKTGLGKSTFAFNLACALAEGRTLRAIPCTARRLLYVDLESGDIGRSLKVQRLYGDRPRQAGRLRFVREPLRLPDESAELVAYAEAEKFDLVIFDTARRVFAVRDENDNAEVYNRVVPTLDALKARGIATLTMGHPPKNGGLGARGAGAQEDAGDVNLSLTMHRGEVSDSDGVIALSITKNRLLGLGTPPLYLQRVGGDQFTRLDARDLPPTEAGDTAEKQSPRDRCRLAVVSLLKSNGAKPVAFKDVVHALEARGQARTTIHRALKELLDEGEVEQPSSGQYVLSDPFA